jgi:membrane-associated phospholipid phosphatase
VLAILVRLGLTQSLDEAVRQWARPDDVWGSLQLRVDVIVEGLRPASTLILTTGVAAAVALARRSARSLLLAAAAGLLLVGVTVAVKLLLHRPDPHGDLSDHGGSFPSGHTATIVVCAGIVTLLLGATRRSWWWLPTALLGTLMAAALLVQAAHWMTDLVGGGLAGVTVLATVIALGGRDWTANSGKTRSGAPDKVSRAAAIRSRHPA